MRPPQACTAEEPTETRLSETPSAVTLGSFSSGLRKLLDASSSSTLNATAAPSAKYAK
ncbi:hypothetical protein [Streptomyces qaidamensis]|uniref:hypothetical protein n=1 Tax=Streptomyces qaidamensis TaxID=1783515 RepID=UPI000A7EB41D|nr:hypothetical protein [Streptomyces qaidamensis]